MQGPRIGGGRRIGRGKDKERWRRAENFSGRAQRRIPRMERFQAPTSKSDPASRPSRGRQARSAQHRSSRNPRCVAAPPSVGIVRRFESERQLLWEVERGSEIVEEREERKGQKGGKEEEEGSHLGQTRGKRGVERHAERGETRCRRGPRPAARFSSRVAERGRARGERRLL